MLEKYCLKLRASQLIMNNYSLYYTQVGKGKLYKTIDKRLLDIEL